jgi:hypothetical protein
VTEPLCVPGQDLMSEGILVSPRMMADHFPDYVAAVLRRMARARSAGASMSSAPSGDSIFIQVRMWPFGTKRTFFSKYSSSVHLMSILHIIYINLAARHIAIPDVWRWFVCGAHMCQNNIRPMVACWLQPCHSAQCLQNKVRSICSCPARDIQRNGRQVPCALMERLPF